MNDTIYYISHELKNVTASIKLRDLFMNGFDHILQFPYGCSIYKTSGVLKNEYRTYKVKNFLIFYTINEDEKIVTVVRILYQKWIYSIF
ncbi:MAG TPA: type II toxin-antitoxin system RelE/ParE family toxin [Candidatus Scybalousia intestinigallinarum]|nr:type II toxin-antitoxin system RelE/ParE family toxin [Candidatus Scybalousia intestinigallinarum]